METLEKLSDVYKEHREIILIGLVGRYYNRVYDSHIGEISGSLSVADFFSKFTDKLLADNEYKEAVIYALTEKIEHSGGSIWYYGGSIWDYFHKKHGTSLDWYYFNKAEKMIDEFIETYN